MTEAMVPCKKKFTSMKALYAEFIQRKVCDIEIKTEHKDDSIHCECQEEN